MRGRAAAVMLASSLVGCSFEIGAIGSGATADASLDALQPSDAVDSGLPIDGNPSTTGRVTSGLVALYEFQEGSGAVALDTSGVTPPLNLMVPPQVGRTADALRFDSAAHVVSSAAATKIFTATAATNEITIETWFEYGALPGWSRVVALSESNGVGNAALTSDPTNVGFDLNTTSSMYERSTMQVFTNAAPAGLHHLVAVRVASGAKAIYLDGNLVQSFTQAGTFGSWNTTYKLSIGNTPALDRPFIGRVHLVAIYDRALSDAEIVTNRTAGANP